MIISLILKKFIKVMYFVHSCMLFCVLTVQLGPGIKSIKKLKGKVS